MKINTAALIYFSPTGTTKKILYAISRGMGIIKPETINLTIEKYRQDKIPMVKEDIVIVGMPVYEERIPEVVRSTLENLTGRGQPIVLAAVYGNIGYGIALKELNDIAKKAGFVVTAGAAFIGEHSFSNEKLSIANERPDASDLQKATQFGEKVIQKLESVSKIDEFKNIEFPGILPLVARILPKNSARFFSNIPNPNELVCNECGACIRVCPVAAINKNDLKVDTKKCLRCFACVKKCKLGVRKITFKQNWLVPRFLKIKGGKRKEPEVFL